MKLTIVFALMLTAGSLEAQTTVKVLSTTSGGQGPIHQCIDSATSTNGIPWNEGCLHDVYIAGAIDQKVGALSNQLANIDAKLNSTVQSIAKPGGPIEQAVAAEDAKIKAEVKQAIDNLPQRLLSEEAKDAIKNAIMAEVQGQLQQLRTDLQQQIDQLKKPAPSPAAMKMQVKPVKPPVCDLTPGTAGGN